MTGAGGIAPREPVGEAGGTTNLNTAARDCTVGWRTGFAAEANGMLLYERAQQDAMTPARVTTLVLGSALLTTWLVSAAVTRHGSDPLPERAAAPVPPQAVSATDDLRIQAERLHARLDAAPAPRRSPRNPFRFGVPVERPSPAEPREAVAAAPVPDLAPLSPPPASLRLVGIAAVEGTGGTVRTAAISVGGVLVLVRPGDDVGGRYRVAALSADVVELTDRLGGPPLRLALR
jgi:hypothetical protein